MVRLKEDGANTGQVLTYKFQFPNGSIKSKAGLLHSLLHLSSFNSLMVRLKVEDYQINYAATHAFQFPNGSIKRLSPSFKYLKSVKFQFPNGSIKSLKG